MGPQFALCNHYFISDKLAEQGQEDIPQGGHEFVREVAAAAAVAAEGAARSARNYWIFSEFSFRDCEAELTVLCEIYRKHRSQTTFVSSLIRNGH